MTGVYLVDEPLVTVSPTLCLVLGDVKRAIILQQIHYLLCKQKEKGNDYTYVEGRYWVYNSLKDWLVYFHWLGVKDNTLDSHFVYLEKQGVLLVKKGVKSSTDRRKWHSIDYARLQFLVSAYRQESLNPEEALNQAMQNAEQALAALTALKPQSEAFPKNWEMDFPKIGEWYIKYIQQKQNTPQPPATRTRTPKVDQYRKDLVANGDGEDLQRYDDLFYAIAETILQINMKTLQGDAKATIIKMLHGYLVPTAHQLGATPADIQHFPTWYRKRNTGGMPTTKDGWTKNIAAYMTSVGNAAPTPTPPPIPTPQELPAADRAQLSQRFKELDNE